MDFLKEERRKMQARLWPTWKSNISVHSSLNGEHKKDDSQEKSKTEKAPFPPRRKE